MSVEFVVVPRPKARSRHGKHDALWAALEGTLDTGSAVFVKGALRSLYSALWKRARERGVVLHQIAEPGVGVAYWVERRESANSLRRTA